MKNLKTRWLLLIIIPLALSVSFVKILDDTTKKRNRKIEYLVVHYTANLHKNADAVANARYLQKKAHAGAHYCIDDIQTIQCTEERNVAYSVGDRKWLGFNPKFWLKGKINNNNSLNFEMCLGPTRNDSMIIDKTAQYIGWQLVNKGLDISHVVRHHDVTGKHCPKFNYQYDWNQSVEDKSWKEFLIIVEKYWKFQLKRKNEVQQFSRS